MKLKIITHIFYKKIVIFIYLITAICSLNLMAQTLPHFSLDKEITFSNNVKQVYFNFENKNDPKPRIEIYNKQIVFYDRAENIRFTKTYEAPIGVSASQNKNYLQVWRHTLFPTKSAIGVNTLEVLDGEGKIRWQKDFPAYLEGLSPYIMLSNKGAAAAILTDVGKLVFCDLNGNEVKKIKFDNIWQRNSEPKASFSDDGNVFIFSLSYITRPFTAKEISAQKQRRGAKRNQKNVFGNIASDVIAFTEMGEKIWQSKIDSVRVGNIFVSPDNKYIVCTGNGPGSQDKITYFFDMKTGEVLLIQKGVNVQQIKFFEKNTNNYAIINDLSNRLVYINISTGAAKFIYTLPSNKKILGITVDEDSQKIGLIEARFGYEPAQRGKRPVLSSYLFKIMDFDGSTQIDGFIPVQSMGFLKPKDWMLLNENRLSLYINALKKVKTFNISK